jgi:hypothetical protein
VKCPAPAGHFSFVRNGPLREGVGDSTGSSRFLLSRTLSVSDDLYRQLLNRASVKGVRGWLTPTRQPQAALAARQLIPIKGASPLDGSATRGQSVSQHV